MDRWVPSNYRPISMTKCVCKLLERVNNRRLVWLLESRHLMTPIQYRFRKYRSTLDHLVNVDRNIFSFCSEAIFLIKKDTLLPGGILRTQYQ